MPNYSLIFLIFLFYMEVQSINNVVIASGGKQIHIHTSILPQTPSLPGCHIILSRVPCVYSCCCFKSLSRVRLFATPWTVAHQAPLSMGFPRQEYWNGLPFPSLGCLSDSGIKPESPALAGGLFTREASREVYLWFWATANLLSFSIYLPVLAISYKCIHVICGLLRLASLT